MVFFLQGLSGDDGIPGRPGRVGDRVCEKKNVYGGSMGFLGSIPPKFEYVDIIKDLEYLPSQLY